MNAVLQHVLVHEDVLQYRIHGRPERSEGIDEEIGRVWMPVFDELLIDVVFTAHLHTYRNRGHIYAFAKTPEQKGPLYILTGVAGNVRYPNLWIDHAFDEVTLPQPETDNYLTMEVAADQIEIACFLPDGTEMDRVTVTKQ
ncbi:MAG: metallophosphoesterase, partial [Selenomonas sp.]|nr:metallophosphoesterase [Selenomonas sp.]